MATKRRNPNPGARSAFDFKKCETKARKRGVTSPGAYCATIDRKMNPGYFETLGYEEGRDHASTGHWDYVPSDVYLTERAKAASVRAGSLAGKETSNAIQEWKRGYKKGFKSSAKHKSNPADGASDLFQEFHGVPSQKVLEYVTKFHIHENLAGLGRLIELVFITPGAKARQVTLEEGDLGAQAWLCASEDAKSLYIIGPVVIDLEQLGYRPDVDVKDAVELGRLTNVVYKTKKEMNGLNLLEYDHELGKRERWQKREGVGPEMNKEVAACPLLIYHTREDRLSVVGGQYLVLSVGITN